MIYYFIISRFEVILFGAAKNGVGGTELKQIEKKYIYDFIIYYILCFIIYCGAVSGSLCLRIRTSVIFMSKRKSIYAYKTEYIYFMFNHLFMGCCP